jgi:flagellar hook-basal body complex protein FliE
MVIPVNMAINAYNNVAKGLAGTSGDDASAQAASGSSFGDVLQSALQSAINVEHKSETVSAQALVGKATPNDVVMAVNNAEVTLQEVSAIRDKVINAYEEILKMPI